MLAKIRLDFAEFYNCLDKIADTQADWIEATIIDSENGRPSIKYYR